LDSSFLRLFVFFWLLMRLTVKHHHFINNDLSYGFLHSFRIHPGMGMEPPLNVDFSSFFEKLIAKLRARSGPSAVHQRNECGIPRASKRYERRDVIHDD
jgi:hypothetical protein